MPYPKNGCPQPSEPLSLTPLTNRPPDGTNDLGIAESRGRSASFSIRAGSSLRASTERLPLNLGRGPLSTPRILQRTSPVIVHEYLIIMAGGVGAIQVQLLASNTVATTSIPTVLLAFGMIFELLGALLAIGSLCIHSDDSLSSGSSLSRHRVIMWLSAVLILMGIAGLAAVLIMETFKV